MPVISKHILPFAFMILASVTFADPEANPFIPSKIEKSYHRQHKSSLSISEFQGILFTELHDELHALQEAPPRSPSDGITRWLRQGDKVYTSKMMWDDIIEHGWSSIQQLDGASNDDRRNHSPSNRYLRKSPKLNSPHTIPQSQTVFPFLVCSRSKRVKSGLQRLQPMLRATGAHKEDAIVVYNDDEQTCFHISTTHEQATRLRSAQEGAAGDHAIVPMIDIMKIAVNTMAEVSEDYWPPLSPTNDYDDNNEESWERLVRVAFAAGDRASLKDDNEVVTKASAIIDSVQTLGQAGAEDRRRRNLQNGGSSLTDSSSSRSISSAFSLTASGDSRRRSLQTSSYSSNGRINMWHTSLERGLEADHGCQHMFDTMQLRPQYDMKGFDIVLNPSSSDDRQTNITNVYSESSASNVHCISSLIMALSVHPSVLHVEVDTPVTADDFESQWITQSKVSGYRPLTDVGLTGKNQIVSIIDSGCHINHRYFGPTDDKIFGAWDMNQRKIVSYDYNRGDKHDITGGHGTSVAGVVAGKSERRDSEGNGVAVDAKLHIFDMKKGGGMYVNPGPRELLESMYNDGKGAKIANGSWSTKYRAYPTSCRMYDDELYEDYQDIVFVASAGNYGRDVKSNKSQMRSIGNPAGCKNTLAVGASQSDGDRIGPRDKGINYLALFSSRGPTADDRMKPDIVAPGYTIMAAHAHPLVGEEDEREVFGTSYAAPVVAGSAALVRQYFEEGWFPCGSKGCNASIQPSGSLVKAVLMNGGQSLNSVQSIIPNNNVLETVQPYDSNQGMGLVNLAASLPIKGVNRFTALAQNNVVIEDRERHTFFVKAKTKGKCKSRDLSMTLSWYDRGAANGCAKCLVNDLDVWVQRLDRFGGVRKGSKKRANGLAKKDSRNNVERIRMRMRHGNMYKISVEAANLSEAYIKYSFIATGCFETVDDPKAVS